LPDGSLSKLSKKWQNSKEYSGKENFLNKPKEVSKLFSKHGGSLKFDRTSAVFYLVSMW